MEISTIKGGVRCLMANAILNFHIFFNSSMNMIIEIPIYYCFSPQIHPDNDYSGRVPSVGRV